MSLLHVSCSFGYLDMVIKLLNSLDIDGNLLNPNIRDNRGESALHKSHDPEIFNVLLENGAHPNSIDLDGNSPLHIKCSEGNLEAIQILLNYEADFKIKNKKV